MLMKPLVTKIAEDYRRTKTASPSDKEAANYDNGVSEIECGMDMIYFLKIEKFPVVYLMYGQS